MKRLLAVAIFCTLGAIGNPTAAAPQCGESYIVAAGDTLSKIARSAYQAPNLWPYIYGYGTNTAVIGRDPSLISIGISLSLPPCLQAGQSTATAPIENDRGRRTVDTIEALTAGDYAPFTDQNWQEGGMVTEIVAAVLSRTDGGSGYSIDWINDWAAHIDPLLRRHKYDMGFPWLKPDCDVPEQLSEEDRKRCEFYFSESLFDMLIVLFKRSDDKRSLSSDDELHGMRLCRPAGYYTFDLTRRGLIPGETIELERPRQ